MIERRLHRFKKGDKVRTHQYEQWWYGIVEEVWHPSMVRVVITTNRYNRATRTWIFKASEFEKITELEYFEVRLRGEDT